MCESSSQPSADIGGIWPLDAAAFFTRYCEAFIEGYKSRAQTMPCRFTSKAIAAGTVTPEILRNYQDNLVTARTWIATWCTFVIGLVMFCLHPGHLGLHRTGRGVQSDLRELDCRVRPGKLIENAMTKCKRLKTYTTTNDKWMTILTSNLLERSLLGWPWNILGAIAELLQGAGNVGSRLQQDLRRIG